jgi:predicted  nucleic acid-binding Zn-ribbon protein
MSMTQAHPEFAARLSRVATDYHAGIALIDRECDDACQRIGLSVGNIRGESAKRADHSKREQSQETRLRQQADTIERDIIRIDGEIARLDQGLAAVDASLQALMQQKASLEQQIQNRWLIERIIYLFVDDKDRQQCARLQRDFDKGAHDKSTLEETRRRLEATRSQMVTNRNSLQVTLDNMRHKLAALRASAENADAQARLLAQKASDAEKRRQSRKRNLLTSVSAAWKRAADEITQGVRLLRRQQPAFVDLRGNDSCIASEMPHLLFLGAQEVLFKQFRCLIPHGIAFPFDNALFLPEDNQAQRRLAHHLLLRLLQAVPPGRLELTLIDPLKLGQSFAPFLPLLNVEPLMPQRRVLTRADEIEHMLGKLTDETEYLIQQRFKGRISNWTEFNAANTDNPLRYKVILLFDVPEQLSEKSLWYLERLAESGPRCGILPIVAVDGQRIEDKRYEKLRVALNHSTQRLDGCLSVEDNDKSGLSYTYLPEEWPRQDALDDFLSVLATRYVELGRFSRALPDLWVDYARGSTTVGGFDIPIGWAPSGETVTLTLGATNSEHHALLAGKTGSGKSNLLHVMIHSLCEKYAPQELDLYLLDYKESTEFTVYAKPTLSHARLVSTESDPEYGVTVLQHLVSELEHRADLFKSVGVRDFAEYRRAHSNQLPRILVIIDEFQVLFAEGRQVAEAAERLLMQLLKQGRSFGIHLLLATQTLKGIGSLSIGALATQLGCRIALACGQEDSAMILSSGNWAAADLKSPPEAIINNSNGAKSGNIKFLIPLAERELCRTHLVKMSERAARRGIESKAKVFNGANLPIRPTFDVFHALRGQSKALLLGERLTFSSDALSVPLVSRQAFNVLFSGYNDLIHDGLLGSSLASMSSSDAFDDIVYFNGRGIEPRGGYGEASLALGQRFRAVSDIDQLPLQEIADAIGKRRIALIMDGLDGEKALHPVQTFRAPRPGEPATPSDLLKRIAEEGPRKGTFVFAFIDNWRRCAVPCKDLLNLFELRVAFCMNEDDAGALVSGGIGKFKGIEKPNRAVFVNRMTNEIHWFRPYTARPEGEPC